MPVNVTERYMDPNDPDDYLARLVAGLPASAAEPDSPWVEPDYASIPGDADIPMDENERVLVWPGPAIIMPAGLLPDGKPHSYNDLDNAARICGERVRNGAEADFVVGEYRRQQNALRERAGLSRPTRGADGEARDSAETLAAIEQLHRVERARRATAHQLPTA